jgi:murein peptide amidase A
VGPGVLIAPTLVGLAVAILGVSDSVGGGVAERPMTALRAAIDADPDLLPPSATTVIRIGESARGRPIRAVVRNVTGGRPLVLAVGCIHGDECAGTGVIHAMGCELGSGDIVAVPNLNPDGRALGTRLNAHGVDLNRNFASDWQAAGTRGDPEYPGRRPFSEPETRLARRLIRTLRPDVTIWFHQQVEPPLVRAWGPSVPAARTYARLAGTPFRRLPWLAGTAPNWQNHHFPGTSSFVVELPWGKVPQDGLVNHALAILELARELRRSGA